MEELSTVKKITIKGVDFNFDIAQLTVNDFIVIEAEKQRISGNQYFKIASTMFKDALNAANLIDMIAVFRVLKPEIESSLSTKSFEKLSLMDIKELLKAFLSEFNPWYGAWMDKFSSFENEG